MAESLLSIGSYQNSAATCQSGCSNVNCLLQLTEGINARAKAAMMAAVARHYIIN